MVHLTQLKKVKAQASATAMAQAVSSLRECASIAQVGIKETDFSESDDDDTQVTLPLFVQKLKSLVDDHEIDSAVWSADGESVMIPEPSRLSDQLCKYFKASKLNSFVRQLHFYGFKKIGGKRNSDWVYSHKYFHEDGRMIHKVRRKTCGPDRQIQNLTLKVETLQGSLAETQRKLGNMASALAALLKEKPHYESLCHGCGVKTEGSHGSIAPIPSKRSHPPSSSNFDFDHFALPKRARAGFPSFDDASPFTHFEMLSPRLLSPRHPMMGSNESDKDAPLSLVPEEIKVEEGIGSDATAAEENVASHDTMLLRPGD